MDTNIFQLAAQQAARKLGGNADSAQLCQDDYDELTNNMPASPTPGFSIDGVSLEVGDRVEPGQIIFSRIWTYSG